VVDCTIAVSSLLQERLTLKHRNSSKWARRALKRGQAAMDPTTRDAINEQLALGQQLRRRIEGKRGDNSEDDEDGSDDRLVALFGGLLTDLLQFLSLMGQFAA
jgi:U3 small nucleolar RNA-associated protein 14